jgi:hypothetical protein
MPPGGMVAGVHTERNISSSKKYLPCKGEAFSFLLYMGPEINSQRF